MARVGRYFSNASYRAGSSIEEGSAEKASDEDSEPCGREFCDREGEDVAAQKTPGEKDVATAPDGKKQAGPEGRPGGLESKQHEANRQRKTLSFGRKASGAKGKAEQNKRWKQTASGRASKNRWRKSAKKTEAAAREEVLKKKEAAESPGNKRNYTAHKAKEHQERGEATA